VSEIEISEADEQFAREYTNLSTQDHPPSNMPDLANFGDWEYQLLVRSAAKFRLAATAAVESRVADAVKAERERIIANIRGIAGLTRLLNPTEARILTQMANAIETANPPEATT